VSSALHGVGGAELATFIAVPLILMGVACLACYPPARDVRRIDRSLYRSIHRPG
jgi:hypothetical protein